jgi:hypothetical protein
MPQDRLILNVDYTIENKKWIFTKEYLLKRGYCCHFKCRNCPYNNERKENMIKELYANDPTNVKAGSTKFEGIPLVKVDDLIYDGRNLIIPGYWTSSILEYLLHIKENSITDGDIEDLENLKSFLSKVEDIKNEGN